jgi:hypothetical protein
VKDGNEYGAMVDRQRQVTGNKVSSATTSGVGSTTVGDLEPESSWKEID